MTVEGGELKMLQSHCPGRKDFLDVERIKSDKAISYLLDVVHFAVAAAAMRGAVPKVVKLLVFVEGCDVLAVGDSSAAQVLPAFFAEGHSVKLCAKSENTKQKVVAAAVTLAGGATITAAIGVTPHASRLHAMSDRRRWTLSVPTRRTWRCGAAPSRGCKRLRRRTPPGERLALQALTAAVRAPRGGA